MRGWGNGAGAGDRYFFLIDIDPQDNQDETLLQAKLTRAIGDAGCPQSGQVG